jgi:hypothetical protein
MGNSLAILSALSFSSRISSVGNLAGLNVGIIAFMSCRMGTVFEAANIRLHGEERLIRDILFKVNINSVGPSFPPVPLLRQGSHPWMTKENKFWVWKSLAVEDRVLVWDRVTHEVNSALPSRSPTFTSPSALPLPDEEPPLVLCV